MKEVNGIQILEDIELEGVVGGAVKKQAAAKKKVMAKKKVVTKKNVASSGPQGGGPELI